MVDAKHELFNPKQAAEHLTVKPQTLAIWRCKHRYDLPFLRVGRLVRYRRSDLDQFLARRTVEVRTV